MLIALPDKSSIIHVYVGCVNIELIVLTLSLDFRTNYYIMITHDHCNFSLIVKLYSSSNIKLVHVHVHVHDSNTVS